MLSYRYIVYQLVYNFYCIIFYNILIHIYFVYDLYLYKFVVVCNFFILNDEKNEVGGVHVVVSVDCRREDSFALREEQCAESGKQTS